MPRRRSRLVHSSSLRDRRTRGFRQSARASWRVSPRADSGERAAGDIDLALLADDDIKRLLEVPDWGRCRSKLVVGKSALRCRDFSGSATVDVLLVELGQKFGGKFFGRSRRSKSCCARLPESSFVDAIELRHHKMKLTEPRSPSSCRIIEWSRRSAIFSRPPCRLSL